jgi:PIN domain nuclease of toxin-antitoxin system
VSPYVLDASALLAYLHGEDGADEVADALSQSASISAANWAETLSKVAEVGVSPKQLADDLEEQGLLHGLLEVVPLTHEDALSIGDLRPMTKPYGLSLGDRACIALALRLGRPVLTADRDWDQIADTVDVVVERIRL